MSCQATFSEGDAATASKAKQISGDSQDRENEKCGVNRQQVHANRDLLGLQLLLDVQLVIQVKNPDNASRKDDEARDPKSATARNTAVDVGRGEQ